MNLSPEKYKQAGFTILEMMLALVVMLIVGSAVFSLMRDSMKVASTTYEMTDAQEGLRTAQEYINRDLMNAGDGLNSISNIRVPRDFALNYLTVSPVNDATAGIANLGIIVSDNDTPQNTAILGTNPALTVRWNPILTDQTDRISILQIDSSFTPIALDAGDINADGTTVLISPGDVGRFNVGEVYFLSSAEGATFATVTDINAAPSLQFDAGDFLGLNTPAPDGQSQIKVVSDGGTIPTSLMRIRIIHYYVNSDGMLRRRVFGVRGVGFTDSLIAEHVINTQFRYLLSLRDGDGNVVPPAVQLTTSQEQLGLNQVEVTVTAETTHAIQSGSRQPLAMTTGTSIRNMQFRGAQQPKAGG